MMMRKLVQTAALAGAMLAATLVSTSDAAYGQPSRSRQPAKAAEAKPAEGATKDVLVFRSGRTVEGEILEENDSTVKIRIIGPGGLSVDTTYNKSEILSIDRKVPVEKPGAPQPQAPERRRPSTGERQPSESATKIYVIEMKGEFGRDVSATPLRQVLADVKAHQPDILVMKLDHDFKLHGEERPEFHPADAQAAFNQLDTARQLSTILTDEIRDDPEWVKKPRLVAWVKRALGGPAFVPFVAPEIYFHPEGRHGGIGYLEFMLQGRGDHVVQEKMYSLLLGRAEGLAIKGGHEPKVIRAMARADYVLSVKMVGGRPIFLERFPESADEELLVDDAKESEGRRDTIQDVVRFRGNDVLILDAERAFRLGISKGTARTVEDLAREMGVGRDFVLIEGRSDRILGEWSTAVTNAERNFIRLWRDHAEALRDPTNNFQERTASRGRRIRILEQIRDLLLRYGEAINPRAIEGAPEQWETQINLMIEQLRQQQRLDRR